MEFSLILGRFYRSRGYSFAATWLSDQVAIEQLFGKLDALELQQSRVLFAMPVQDQIDLPGPRERSRILDGRFVIHGVRVDQRVAFHHVQAVAGKIAGAIEPGVSIESG